MTYRINRCKGRMTPRQVFCAIDSRRLKRPITQALGARFQGNHSLTGLGRIRTIHFKIRGRAPSLLFQGMTDATEHFAVLGRASGWGCYESHR